MSGAKTVGQVFLIDALAASPTLPIQGEGMEKHAVKSPPAPAAP